MEENRLRPMPTGYDEQLFNKIYQDTRLLTNKLAYSIDHRRFGVDQEEIKSWFDVKFLYAFTKYYGATEGILKANVIKSLQHFKVRIIKAAYTKKFSQNIISTEDAIIQEPIEVEESKDYYYEKMMAFMKDHLSANAYCLLDLQLNPTPYILSRINPGEHSNLQKIPDELLAEYFDLGTSEKALNYITQLKKEIRNAVNYAKTFLN